ncbi:MAG TPA: hypothetical protein P5307_17095 [Pirellulaceae bacterium]|nr:hypothetical protein [Planctomycetales bacterium]HRX80791.1 hypothetical protein [Pirellulaceae bacterium]
MASVTSWRQCLSSRTSTANLTAGGGVIYSVRIKGAERRPLIYRDTTNLITIIRKDATCVSRDGKPTAKVSDTKITTADQNDAVRVA